MIGQVHLQPPRDCIIRALAARENYRNPFNYQHLFVKIFI